MNEQMFNDVLTDILDELKQSNLSLKTLQATVKDLQERTVNFEEKLSANLDLIRKDVDDKINTILSRVEVQPKNVVKQYRLSLFPDNDYNGHFKFLLNKLSLIIICIAIIGALYSLGLQYLTRRPPQTATTPTESPATPTPSASNPTPTRTAAKPPVSKIAEPFPHQKNHLTDEEKQKLKNYLDTLYNKYMYKNEDSLSGNK